MTTYTVPNNIYFAKIAVKLAPGVPEVEVLPLAVPKQKSIISGDNSQISGKVRIPHRSV